MRYWEIRRLFFNLALLPPSFFGFMLTSGLLYVGDPHETHYGYVTFWFVLSALGANLWYSFVYALEFFCWSGESQSRWTRRGRLVVFVLGVLFSMFVALIGGRNIAEMEFAHGL